VPGDRSPFRRDFAREKSKVLGGAEEKAGNSDPNPENHSWRRGSVALILSQPWRNSGLQIVEW
jgi:hypothetical protein